MPEIVAQWLAPLLRSSQRRVVTVLCCLAVAGLALLLMGRTSPPRAVPPDAQTVKSGPAASEPDSAARLAEELAGILRQIAGAGQVEVSLTFAASTANQWEQNCRRNRRTVEDRNQDGGVQVTSEETEETTLALARRADGSEAPIETQSTPPQVAGAIVVADGARTPRIKAELARATAAFLGIGLHRVMVFPREVGK